MPVRYLDLDLIINGGMDAFILVLTGRLLHLSLKPWRLFGGVILGEIPVLLVLLPFASLLTISKVLTPFLMVGVGFSWPSYRHYFKGLLCFWLMSAGLGGLVYALWGWAGFNRNLTKVLSIGLHNLWLLPLAALFWWLCQIAWQKIQLRSLSLHRHIYNLEIDFGEGAQLLRIKALLDTGNQLRDPLTNKAVILVEEEAAAAVMPEELRQKLRASWREYEDPWPWLWQEDPVWLKKLVFIPYQTIDRRSWLLGIRMSKIYCQDDQNKYPLNATLALVQQALSPDGAYQALLHPELVQMEGVENASLVNFPQ